MSIKILGFTGRMGSGKTYLANQLQKWLLSYAANPPEVSQDYFNVLRYSFANKIKDYAARVLHNTSRAGYQKAGDLLRETDPDFTVKDLRVYLESVVATAPRIVVIIDDARCLNEVHEILACGGTVYGLLTDEPSRLHVLANRDGKTPTALESAHKTEPNAGPLLMNIAVAHPDLLQQIRLVWNDYTDSALNYVKQTSFPLIRESELSSLKKSK